MVLLGLLGAEAFRRLHQRNLEVLALLEELRGCHQERESLARELIWWRAAAHISDDIRALVGLRLAWQGIGAEPRPQGGFEAVPMLLVAKAVKPGQA